MANGKDDIRVALGMPRHPKTLQLIAEAGERAAWALVSLWCFAGENRPSGVLRSPQEAEVASGWRGKRGALHAALVSCGWIDPDGVTLHDWADEQPWIANRPARVAAAVANGVKGGLAKAAKACRNPGERPSGTLADGYRNPGEPLAPSPSPSPTPTPQPPPPPVRHPDAAAAEPSRPEAGPPDPLAVRLAERLHQGKPDTCVAVLAELRSEGTPEPWLVARVEATPDARAMPWDWAKAARQARPKVGPATDQERIVAQRAAESHAKRYREHLAAGRAPQAASSWAQVVSFARDAGIDPETLRHDPMEGPGRAA